MLFNSVVFFVFFFCTFFIFRALKPAGRKVFLLLASYFFYGSYKPVYALLLFASTLSVFVAAQLLTRYSRYKKLILISTVGLNLLVLFVFKYYGFATTSIAFLLAKAGVPIGFSPLLLLLPVGISFYTFQVIGYLSDVYTKKIAPENDFVTFALFVSFFPQLVAGPIERSQTLLPQLKKLSDPSVFQVKTGLQLFFFGLFKKVIIADTCAVVVNRVFEFLPEYKGLSLLIAMLLFSVQIYYDFSGYTDMARGVARMLGIDLIKNFTRPYASASIREFWRKWHRSLSYWIRDYAYIPLGGSRKGLARTVFNYCIVFTLCGLWHGAAVTFVLWGLVHGVVISLEKVVSTFTSFSLPRRISQLYTFGVVLASWVLFRAQSLADALYVYRYGLSGFRNFVSPQYLRATIHQLFEGNWLEFGIVVFVLALFVGIESFPSNTALRQSLAKSHPLVRAGVYFGALFLLIHLRNAQVTEFIYFQF